MPSNNGITKLCAHDKAKTVASAPRIPSARPRALTAIRTAGTMSEASIAEAGCSTRTTSVVLAGVETAAEFIARNRTATWGAELLRARSAYAHFQVVGWLSIVEAI